MSNDTEFTPKRRAITLERIRELAKRREVLEIPALPDEDGRPGVFYLKTLPAGDVLEFSNRLREEQKDTGVESVSQLEAANTKSALWFVARAVVDENDHQVFSEDDLADVRDLAFGVFNIVFSRISEMNGLSTREVVKNESGKTQDGDSLTS